MGFINFAKDLLIQQGGKAGVNLLRKVGKSVVPGLERSAERAFLKHRRLLTDIGGVANSVLTAAAAVREGDPDAFIGAGTRGVKAFQMISKDVKAARSKGSKKRKRVPNKAKGMSAEVDGEVANQPRISGDLMDRMAKVARV